jgi:hypothetical protein
MRQGIASVSALAFVLAMVVAVASASAAPTKTVLVDGSDTTADTAGCGTKANPCNTIQAGIDNAAAGDTVRVAKGTYAGAVVNKAVQVEAQGEVVVDTGPYSHPGFLRAGFLFNADRSGSGASISGFTFVGTQQGLGNPDDGKLDFAVFSRGADNVVVSHNSLTNVLQGITDWNGTGWTIDHNSIGDLWTLCGGGIGVLVGGFDGVTPITGNAVSDNDVDGTLHVDPADCGGYDGTGIVLYADFRFGRAGAPSISGNTVEHNKVELVSDTPSLVNANGIELTVAYDPVPPTIPTTISGNLIAHNAVKNTSGNAIAVSAGSGGNTLDKNHLDSVETDAVDESSGTGTAGTANTWTGNKCDTSSPPGLCDS